MGSLVSRVSGIGIGKAVPIALINEGNVDAAAIWTSAAVHGDGEAHQYAAAGLSRNLILGIGIVEPLAAIERIVQSVHVAGVGNAIDGQGDAAALLLRHIVRSLNHFP